LPACICFWFSELYYLLEKAGSEKFGATRAKQNPNNFPTVAFYVFPVVMTWLDKENENEN
jgi:hypothetical protein